MMPVASPTPRPEHTIWQGDHQQHTPPLSDHKRTFKLPLHSNSHRDWHNARNAVAQP